MLWLFWSTGCIFGLAIVQGSGVSASEARDLGPFDAVAGTTEVDVEVVAGDPSVTVTCDDNLLPYIETVVIDGLLRIRTPFTTQIDPRTACTAVVSAPELVEFSVTGSGDGTTSEDWANLASISTTGSGDLVVSGALPALDDVRCTGSGNIDVDGIATAFLAATATGSGQITLAGTADEADLQSTGSGGIDAQALTVTDATVLVTGSGDISLTATGAVEADLTGSGNVDLWGDPVVNAHRTGSGDVILH